MWKEEEIEIKVTCVIHLLDIPLLGSLILLSYISATLIGFLRPFDDMRFCDDDRQAVLP